MPSEFIELIGPMGRIMVKPEDKDKLLKKGYKELSAIKTEPRSSSSSEGEASLDD